MRTRKKQSCLKKKAIRCGWYWYADATASDVLLEAQGVIYSDVLLEAQGVVYSNVLLEAQGVVYSATHKR